MDIFNSLWVLGECLLDEKRTTVFQKAIHEVVTKGDIVLDAGTGSGILSLFAAEAGAAKVYSIDIGADAVKQAKKNINASKYKNKIEIRCLDLKKLKKFEKIDMLIMEMLDTGLVSEQQAVVLNHLRKIGIITSETKMLPYKATCVIEAIDYDFEFYGFQMPFIILARNNAVNAHVKNVLSKNMVYKEVDFTKHIGTKVDIVVKINIVKDGLFNALRLKTKTFLSKSVAIWGTSDMNMPAIIPLKPKKCKAGDIISVSIIYKMSEGFQHFHAEIV